MVPACLSDSWGSIPRLSLKLVLTSAEERVFLWRGMGQLVKSVSCPRLH